MHEHRRRTRRRVPAGKLGPDASAETGLIGLQGAAGNRTVTNLLGGGLDRPESALSPELEAAIADARGRGSPPPADVRDRMERGLGADLGGVRIHDGPEAWALTGELGAAAFADRSDVFFRRGAYRPGTPEGGALLAHELAHASDQLAGAVAPGPQLAKLDEARARVAAERRYDSVAEQLEIALGPHLSVQPKVNEIVDGMLARLRRIIDAWAWATKTGKEEVYGQEFAFGQGQKYYGSFLLTAAEIKKVFEQEGQPLRKKLNLVYYATRNNNLGKYLELAALELKDAAKGAARDRKVRVPGPGKSTSEVTVRAGFAGRAGLKEIWEGDVGPPVGATSEKEAKRAAAKRLAEATEKGEEPVFGKERSSALGMGKTNAELSKEKRYGAYEGLDLAETRTLLRGDVADITAGELRLIYEREGKSVPRWISHRDKAKFRRLAQTKILWEQGGENIEVVPNSETQRIAGQTRSRLEGGISGSTDLMMHVSKHLGFSDLNELKWIRTALVAWMLSNRDHSFFEIMRVAADYGPPFTLDPANPGAEYENPDHFYPLGAAAVRDFAKLLPGGKMPSYYLGAQYRGSVEADLPNLGTSAAVRDSLRAQGLDLAQDWKTKARSYDLAQWLAVRDRVAGLSLQPGKTEDALRKNRIEFKALMRDNSWLHLLKPGGDPKAATNLRALIGSLHGADVVVADDYLTDAGIPAPVFASLEEYKRYDLARLCVAVEAAAATIGAAAGRQREDAVGALSKSLPFAGAAHHIGAALAELVLSSLLAKALGPTKATSREARAAKQLGEYGAFVAAHPTAQAQAAHLQALGVPESWMSRLDKAKDPALARSQVATLATVIAAVPYAAGEAADSKTNLGARKAVEGSSEYRRVARVLGDRYVVSVYAYLLERAHGARRVPAAEHAKAFGRKTKAEQLDELVALGVPRDIAERKDVAPAIHALRRAVVEAPFDRARPGGDAANTAAWSALVKTAAFGDVRALVGHGAVTQALTATLVTSVHGAGVLAGDAALRARAMQQRLGPGDRQRFGKPAALAAGAIDALATPPLKGEAPPTTDQERKKRDKRYWASADASATLKTNISEVSPTIKAQLQALRKKLRTDSVRNAAIDEACNDFIAQQPESKPTLAAVRKANFDDRSVDEQIDTLIALLPPDKLVAKLDPAVRDAIVAIQNLSDRERGALFQYTNKLHEEIGYATKSFSTSDDFGAADLQSVTKKLRSLHFMLPMLEAMHSALEKLPPYAGKVYSGRSSGRDLTTKDDARRREYAAAAFAVGSVVTYAFPLSTAKTVDASYIVKAGTDLALVIAGIRSGRDIEYVSNKPKEEEVLFPQGARFEVVKVEPQPPADLARDETKDKLWVYLRET
jgi:hypothetical protein